MPIDLEKDDVQTALKKLKARENTFRQLEAMTKLGSWEVDLQTRKSIWSDQSYINYGYKPKEIEPNLDVFLSHLVPKDRPRAEKALQEMIQTGDVSTFQCQLKKDDGEIIDLHIQSQVIFDELNTPLKIIGTTQDITRQIALQKKSEELSQLLELSSNELYIIDYDTLEILYANKGACEALGYTHQELMELTIIDINENLTLEMVNLLKNTYKATQKAILNKAIHRRKDASTYHVQSYIYEFMYNAKRSIVIFDTDITQTIEAQEQINYKENYDILTSLPNRNFFQEKLVESIKNGQKYNKKFALLFIDLDHFKKINDSLGHEIGDKVIAYIAKRLKKTIQNNDIISRIGGDEFTVILKNISNSKNISAVAKRMIETIKEPIQIDELTLHITASIGISLYPNDSADANDLKKFSDAAMYKAKDEGRNNFQFYSSEMTKAALDKVIMENSLSIAVKEKQFVVYYQPQYNSISNKIIGMEALVRWHHPDLGIIPPNSFLPIAHETGMIIDIDTIVMAESMSTFVNWYNRGLNPGKLSLNLTMMQLNAKDFISKLLTTMKELEFNPQWLELEVLESHIMSNPEQSIEKLTKINKLGVDIAIDDFGTGYSSLAYLKRLPLDKLKIDRSFVMDLPDDEEDLAITKAIIALGKSLNLHIIAEGVENNEQKEFLMTNGCYNIQGYLYSKPIPSQEMTNLLEKEPQN